MGDHLSILCIVCGFIAAVAVLLRAKPKTSKRLAVIAGILALVGGLLVYGYGYIATPGGDLEAVLHAVFAVCRMFIGETDFADISEAPLFERQWAVTLCWCVHVLAFYATSSAAISLIGVNALKNLRLRMAAKKDLTLLYGVNEDSVRFGQILAGDLGETVVYVSEEVDSSLAETVAESGCVLRTDPAANRGNVRFLKSLGIRKGKRGITVYALHKVYDKNIAYAERLLEAFDRRGVESGQLTLVIHAREDAAVQKLQASTDRFGYGFVTAFQEEGLAARLLIREYPPCRSLSFDETAAAEGNFEALVIGFGALGQVVLRSLIMNGQFTGSTFRADVFDPDMESLDGCFRSSYPGVLENYQLHFHPYDGRSRQLYGHLQERMEQLRCIVLCTGSEEMNEQIGEELRSFLTRKGSTIPVYQCSGRGIKFTDGATGETTVHPIYHPDVLATQKLDRMAMTVNRYYQGENSKGALADWMACDYLDRMSNRAFADFLEAVLQASGKTEADAREGRWQFSEAQLENLGKMEHARWNAFHFCMGFTPMSEEEYAQRGQVYRQQLRAGEKEMIRIGKNPKRRTHACLIPWEALDELSARENAITGGSVDYRRNDINNILLLPQLLRIRDRQEEP